MAKMDILDKKYELKKFLRLIFEKVDFEEEEIAIRFLNKTKDINIVKKFDDIDKLINYVLSYDKLYDVNTYFYLCTFKKGTKELIEENIAYRYCLACDYDRKDFDYLDVDKAIKLYRKSKLSYHAIVDSGNGYHIYSCIERTNDFDKLKKILKSLKTKNILSCDENALSLNQMLRLSMTFNVKNVELSNNDKDRLFVNNYYTENRSNKDFRRYSVNELYNKFCGSITLTGDRKRNRGYCLEDILENGSKEGNRHNDMLNIVCFLRDEEDKSKEEIRAIVEKWAIKSNYVKEFKKDFDSCFNKNSYFFKCKDCKDKDKCNYLYKKEDKKYEAFAFDENYNVNDFESKKVWRSLKMLNGNELLIVNILNNYNIDMNRKELIKELTYKKKCRMSKPILSETLNSLEEKGYIEVIKKRSGYIYKLTDKFKFESEACDIKISYMCSAMCICRNISVNELKLYYALRIIHHKKEAQGKETYCGSLFCMTQKEIGRIFKEEFGGTNDQSNISKMMSNLEDCKMIKLIEERENSKGYKYKVYQLNA